jgi:RNA polymerase sigma factor (sigma-70 family)
VSDASEVDQAVSSAHRNEWARVLAATMRTTRSLDVAEECVQEAYAEALTSWARTGIPSNPGAWLTTTAKRRALDALRRELTLRTKLPLLVQIDETPNDLTEPTESDDDVSTEDLPDDQLRLIFMCCHPALSPEAQMALTLRLVCGMSTVDIARVFLVSPTTMGARLTRAKRKIEVARIPVRVPRAAELPERLRTVLGVVHVLFTMGHTAPSGETLLRVELLDESLHLARLLHALMPDEREVAGLLGLLLATDARRATRVGADGELLRLSEQDRTRWNHDDINEARGLILGAPRAGRPGRYIVQGAIALVHAEAPTYDETDWTEILRLYDQLLVVWPSPVVALNRAVAVSMVSGPEKALWLLEELEQDDRLANYQYLPIVKAELLTQLGRVDDATIARERARALANNEAERAFLAST